MSEAKFFPLKKFLIVNRGDEIPENVTVLCDGGRELVIKHANSFEARRELQYQAKLLGANALLNVHVDWFSPGGLTRYMAYGTPAVCGRQTNCVRNCICRLLRRQHLHRHGQPRGQIPGWPLQSFSSTHLSPSSFCWF